jgi:hypothetical protein
MIYDLDGMLPQRAFQRDARGQIKPQGGGGQSAPSSQNVTQTSIPEYARPYVEKSLGQAAALTDIQSNPYQAYGGQRTSAFSPMQAQAMGSVANMQTSGQLTDASNIAYTAGQQGLGAQQNAMGLQNTALGYGQAGAGYGAAASQYGAQGALQAQQAAQRAQRQAAMYGAQGAQYGGQGMEYGARGADIGQRGVSAAEQGFGAGSQYENMATSPGSVGQYMSPYMQNAVDVQKNEAIRDYQKTMPALGAQAVKSGAFGGSRQAIVDAEAQRNLNTQLGNIQAQGSQQAYDKAMQSMQFGSNLGLQGLQAGYQGLQTGMQGTAQGIQGAQAGMQGAGLGLQGVGQQIAAGQLGLQGANTGIQGQQAAMQGTGQGLAGVQAAIGAGQYGLQGTGAANQAAGTLGQLGQTQFGQETAITDAQMKAGQMQQQQDQRGLDIQYQNYMDSLNYPYKQLGFMSDMYRGLPLTQGAQSMYQAEAPPAQQLMGLGLGAAGMKKAFG